MVGELVEAEVGLHDETVADLGDDGARGHVEDALGVGRPRADGVARRRYAEEHDAAEARTGRAGGERAHTVEAVLLDARHGGDRLRGAQALAHENGQHEVPGRHVRLADEAAQSGRRTQAAGADARAEAARLCGLRRAHRAPPNGARSAAP